MKTQKTELLPENATPAEIEAAIHDCLQRENRPSIYFITFIAAILLCAFSLSCLAFAVLKFYPEAIASFLLATVTYNLLFFWLGQMSKPLYQMGDRLFNHTAPLTFRQNLFGYSFLSEKQKKQSLERVLQTLRTVSAEEVTILTPKERAGFLRGFLTYAAPEIVLETMNLAKRLELVEALPFLERIVKKQAGLYKNREVRTRAREVITFLAPLAALQRTEAQLLRPAPAATPPEQLLRVPQEANEPGVNLLHPVE